MDHPIPEALRARFGDRLRQDEPLDVHTSFRVGGPAELFISAKTPDDLADAVAIARAAGLPWLVLGRGSNVLIDSRGVRGLIIRNDSGALKTDLNTGVVQADSGVRLPTIGARTAKAGLAGFEWAVGIPGSVGGAVVMNAGAHGGCVADVLVEAELLVADQRVRVSGDQAVDGASDALPIGRRESWPVAAFGYAYRTSRLQQEGDLVVLGATFRLTPASAAEALARVQQFRQHRQETQPTDPGAGSIFRNPPDNSAGRLVEQAGLKGTRRGGALISPKHGNFIVNVGGATSDDVLALIDLARETVFRTFGILLQPEVKVISENGVR